MKLNRLSMLTWGRTRVNETELKLPAMIEKTLSDLSRVEGMKVERLAFRSDGISKEALEMNRKYCTEYMMFQSEEGELSKEYRVEHTVDERQPLCLDRKDVVAKKNSQLTVILDYSSGEKIPRESFRNTAIKIVAEEGAEVSLIYVSREEGKHLSFASVEADIHQGAKVHLIQAEVGSERSLFHCDANLLEKEAAMEIDSIYFTDCGRELELDYRMNHFGKKSVSRISVHGALKSGAKKTFKGTIDFKTGCTESKGSEEEFATLLDDDVRNIAVPVLLCQEDDVEGVHAASAGKIEEDLLFYLMSRGLDFRQAQKTIVESQMTPTLDLIPVEELREHIRKKIEKGI